MKKSVYFKTHNINLLKVCMRTLRERRYRKCNFSDDVLSAFRANSKRNASLIRKIGGTGYVLCTGPSSAGVGAEDVKDGTVISVSHFYNHPQCAEIRPSFHIIAPNHPPFGADHYHKYVDGLREWDWSFRCVFGYSPYQHSIAHFMTEHGVPDFQFSFYETDLAHFRKPESFLVPRAWDFGRTLPPSSTVLIPAIQLAVYIGCNRIILLGCDHDYADSIGKPEVPHFYASGQGHDDSEHLLGISTEKWFNLLAWRWACYRYMRLYCEARGVEIVNATAGSKLDVFRLV